MPVCRSMRFVVVFLFVILFVSCGMFRGLLVQYSIKPQDARRYQPQGILMFGTIETPATADVKGVVIFYDSDSDLYLPTINDNSRQTIVASYMADVTKTNALIGRFGIRYSQTGAPEERIVIQTYRYTIPKDMDSGLMMMTNIQETITTNTTFMLIVNTDKKGNSRVSTNNVWNIQTNQTISIISTRRVFYAGRFLILNKKNITEDFLYTIRYTNTFEEDKALFLKEYFDVSNYTLVPLADPQTN